VLLIHIIDAYFNGIINSLLHSTGVECILHPVRAVTSILLFLKSNLSVSPPPMLAMAALQFGEFNCEILPSSSMTDLGPDL
jgi:hypothetical protein